MADVRPESLKRITTKAQADEFIADQIKQIKEQVGDRKVLLALSGGVDSSVVAALLIKAIGDNLVCVHVNHGLLRKGEPEMVCTLSVSFSHANALPRNTTRRTRPITISTNGNPVTSTRSKSRWWSSFSTNRCHNTHLL